jgi:hypothetical protein
VYSPPLLLPQALVMRYLGRSLKFPALIVFYACRIAGLFSYLLLTWLAVRLIPFGKWILALLAVSPVAVLQASTVSADTISNGIAFLFIAGALALAANQKTIDWKHWLSLSFLFLILFWGKLNMVPLAILPFLILKPSQFNVRFGYLTLLLAAIGLGLVEALGWNLLAYSRLFTAPAGTEPMGQIKLILAHPLAFSGILARDIKIHGVEYFYNWIAVYGYNYWSVPAATYYLYLIGLLAALFLPENRAPDQKLRIGLGVLFVLACLVTISSLYVTFTPVGSQSVNGVQGRYFVTVMPLLFLALACLPLPKRIQIPSLVPVILGSASLIVYVAGMYLSYHVPCGAQFYQAGLCYQPNYKNWAPDDLYSPPVSDQLTLSQEIVPECSGLTELRVWINAQGSDLNGATRFTLTEMNTKHEAVNLSVPNSQLPIKDWYSLTFPPDWSSSGKFYLLKIQNDRPGSAGPRISYSLRPEYPAGKLYENDQALTKDMIFQTGCIAGWDKLRLTGSP